MRKGYSRRAVSFGVATKPKHKKRGLGHIRSAAIETLEGRTLLSNSVSLSNGLLTITGSSTAGCDLTANLVNSGKSIDASADDGHAITVALSSVKKISIVGGSGDDYIFVDDRITVPVTISGGAGNDTIRGGGGANTITDGSGKDWIDGRGATNSITVGDGNDTVLGASGNDTITAGNGNDSLDGADGNDSITAGNGNDTITGDSGNDTLVAGNGKDSVNGGLGNDSLTVGTGKDTVVPGSGTNYVVLGSSSSTVVPSSGKNTVVTKTTSTPVTTTPVTTTPVTTTPVTTTPVTTTPLHPTPITPAPPVTVPVSTPTITAGSLTTGSTNWVSYSAAPASGTAPRAIMQILAPVLMVGIAIDTRALNSTLGYGSPIDANYQWDFGDTGSQFNTLPGFNASHIYNNPGKYTITLAVTNGLRQTSIVSATVTIAADTRRDIYVNASSGNDNNNGSTPSKAVKTAARAAALVGNDTEVLFACGQTFSLGQAFKLDFTNVLVRSYGSGSQPVISYTSPGVGTVIFTTNSGSAKGVTVEDLTLTTLDGTDPTVANQPMGVMAGGYAMAVVGCTFDYVEYDVNASAAPVGLTVEDNSSPIRGGLEGYFVWDEATDTTIMGNYVNGSVHEHVVRTSSATEILAYQNDFNNYDGKGCIEIHVGAYAWIDGNTVDGGDIRTGPLGLWGEPVTDSTDMCVVQNNHVDNTNIQVYPGAHDISIRNNIITRDGNNLIDVIGEDSYGRQSADIRILNNTGFDTSSTGEFLKVENHTDAILLENNLLIQPTLAVGGYTTAPVYVAENNLSSFIYITGNVWQEPATFYSYAHGGINYIGATYTGGGYQTPSEWNSYTNVGTDYFSNTPLVASNDAPTASAVAAVAGTPVPGVFTDIYGGIRPATGKWTAGAV